MSNDHEINRKRKGNHDPRRFSSELDEEENDLLTLRLSLPPPRSSSPVQPSLPRHMWSEQPILTLSLQHQPPPREEAVPIMPPPRQHLLQSQNSYVQSPPPPPMQSLIPQPPPPPPAPSTLTLLPTQESYMQSPPLQSPISSQPLPPRQYLLPTHYSYMQSPLPPRPPPEAAVPNPLGNHHETGPPLAIFQHVFPPPPPQHLSRPFQNVYLQSPPLSPFHQHLSQPTQNAYIQSPPPGSPPPPPLPPSPPSPPLPNPSTNPPLTDQQEAAPSRPIRARRNPPQITLREGKTETIPTPYPWAINKRATIHTLKYLLSNNIRTIKGEVQCKKCEKQYEIEYDLQKKFLEIGSFIFKNKNNMRDRAPDVWKNPSPLPCKFCNQEDSVKPIIAEKKRSINWLFLFLGQILGFCTLEQLKYFCKHNNHHRTGAKDRVVYLTYLCLIKQLDPSGPFSP